MSFRLTLVLVLLFVTSSHNVHAGEIFQSDNPERLWNEGEFTEGVAVRSDGVVFFSDIPGGSSKGRILEFNPVTERTTVFSSDSRKSNGLYFDSGDTLYACCGADGGARALCVVHDDGSVHPIVEQCDGVRLNSPNDLVVHPNGSIYFSDPRYRGSEPMEAAGMFVYRYVPATGRTTIAVRNIEKPNGVHVTRDGRTLFVAETNNGSTGLPGTDPGPVGRMTLNAFDLGSDGMPRNKRVLVDFGKETGVDGMAVDAEGRIFAAVRSPSRFGIGVYTSDGTELDFVATEALPTNCCFGVGNDRKTLYVTAGTGLYRLQLR